MAEAGLHHGIAAWRRRLGALCASLLLAACATPPAGSPAPSASDGARFAALGDVPYSQAQANRLGDMLAEINAAAPAFAIHLGDITSGQGPCSDEWLQARARQFETLSTPFVLVPGDNEWTDCHRSGYDPLERLNALRNLFHAHDPRLPAFARQSADARFTEYREHVRWVAGRALFVTLNVPGSNNNLGRTQQMDAEHARRMFAVFDWLDEAFALAESRHLDAVVVLMHANPGLDERARPRPGVEDGYAALRRVLVEQARWFARPVILMHGDTHGFRRDHPLPEAPNLLRIEADGWPALGWLHVSIPALQTDASSDAVRVRRHLLR